MKKFLAAAAALTYLAQPAQNDATARTATDNFKSSASILIDKSERKVMVYQNEVLAFSFPADFGKDCTDMRDKSDAIDTCTPEGSYKVLEKRGINRTRRYKELLLDYPTQDDLSAGARAGAVGWRDIVRDLYYRIRRGHPAYDTKLGGPFGIQGYGGTGKDWTDGYVAISNEAMDKIFPIVVKGSAVNIVK
ncbi:MAG: ErfK/YbiS/YcfS/YnhG family protein [archaeon GW2011_AR5]|nr:MAG: ErfK/YbiS/YcfS/YnhG family protein [archaeon GW2011_AR5]